MVHNCLRLFESGRVKAMIFPSGENLGEPSEGPWVKMDTSLFGISASLILDIVSLDVRFTSDSTNIRRSPSGERDGLETVVKQRISLGVIDLGIY